MNTEGHLSTLSLKEPSFFQKITKRKPKENAYIEINNILSVSMDFTSISVKDILEIAEKYNVDIYVTFAPQLRDIYAQYFQSCLYDLKLTQKEISNLKHLQKLLYLSNRTVLEIHNSVFESIYAKQVEEVISDGIVTEEEKKKLRYLKNSFKISQETSNKIYHSKAEEYIQKFLGSVAQKQRLSPEEEEQINEISNNLGVTLNYDEKTKQTLDMFKLFWQIENGEIPEIRVNVNLQKQERCFFYYKTEWFENRRVTNRIRYSGPTARIRIFKGLYWRIGDLGVQTVSEDVLKKIDVGVIYITNKRLIFMGSNGSKTIKLSQILDFVPYKNGVEIQKSSGKNPFLQFENMAQLFCMILERLIRDQKG